ncbi:hypothetical protein [Streptomyces sp. x-19]|uniref:hypothetical protein n=1 Tax=Streptomyces sp. x-19 TaxID=2789280 RepID=UPI00397FEB55
MEGFTWLWQSVGENVLADVLGSFIVMGMAAGFSRLVRRIRRERSEQQTTEDHAVANSTPSDPS